MAKKKKKFKDIWCNQTEIGKAFGLSSIKVGKILTELGYKDSAGATQKAVDKELATFTPMKDGTAFWMWHKTKTRAAIQAAGYQRLDAETMHKNSVEEQAQAIFKEASKLIDEGQDKVGFMLLFDASESKEVQNRVDELWEKHCNED